ncbi:hypervirulence associated TUDOR domain-containing protein [Mucilaginibacter ginkgonis]|nr:DUF2945 domain-containing protein [Mucilaginibacter ginkgonis]
MKKGDTVHWEWGAHEAEGKVVKKETKTVNKRIKGAEVKRKGTKEEPAVTLKTDKGQTVLKSESELKKGPKKK